ARSQERGIERARLEDGRTPRAPAGNVGFFFQAEDGIRVKLVTGVQTCALPISTTLPTSVGCTTRKTGLSQCGTLTPGDGLTSLQIGRASCRERVEIWVEAGAVKKKKGWKEEMRAL